MTTLSRMKEPADKVYAQYRYMIRSMVNSIVVNSPSVVSAQDLQQAGALALVVALKSYEPSLGSLSSYIRQCVRNALLQQANSFNNVFTVDEKVRRQANAIIKLRSEGVDDDEIMIRLGIKTRATFLSLLGLVENHSVGLDQIEIEAEASLEQAGIFKMLDEIGLSKSQMQFINLVIDNYSMDEIAKEMDISRAALYAMKASIRDQILAWGQEQ